MNVDLRAVLIKEGATGDLPAVPTEIDGQKCGGPKPDIIIVRGDGKIDVIEVQSITSQNDGFMNRTVANIDQYLQNYAPSLLNAVSWQPATKSVADLYGVALPQRRK